MPSAWPVETEKEDSLANGLEQMFQGNDEQMSDVPKQQALQ